MRTHPAQTVLHIEDVTTGVLGGRLPVGRFQNVAGRLVHKAVDCAEPRITFM
jgi:hypothetical protein